MIGSYEGGDFGLYNVKVKKYAGFIRVYRYDNPVGFFPDKEAETGSPADARMGIEGNPPDADGNRARSVRRTKQMIYDYAISNEWDWFVTMSFDGAKVDRYEYAAVSTKMSQWLENQRKNNAPGLKYMMVPEQHEDGAWHFHGLLSNCGKMRFKDLGFVDKKSGRQMYRIPSFRSGITNATKIGSSDKAVNYITKYVTKESDGLLRGKKRYWNSRNLELPEVEYGYIDYETYLALMRKLTIKKEPTYTKPILIDTPDYKNCITICEIR